jgi:nucleotide-binding universal stress UspA family protein
VVCGLDGSSSAEGMLAEAAGWAHALRVPLWLVQAVEGAPALETSDGAELADSTEARYLQAQVDRLAAAGVEASPDVVHDRHPGAALVGWLNAQPGTMTVLATHGRTGLAAVELGGTAGAVVRNATGPVVLRRPAGLDAPDRTRDA